MLSLRLKRNGGALVRALMGATLVVVLAAMMLALSAAEAKAQAEAQAEDKSTPSLVVRPGDSLWSISEEQLGPNATPQRIVEGAEQIYALNRERIGPDPNLILVGQELLVPPAMSERPTGATAPAHKTTTETTEAAGAGQKDQAAKRRATRITADKAPRTTPSGAGAKGDEAPETVAQPAGLSDLPNGVAAVSVPAVKAVASNGAQPSPVASIMRTIRTEVVSATSAMAEADGRRPLSLVVLVLTLLVAALVAWKLPMRRTTRGDAERWGTSSGYYGYYNGETTASRINPFAYHPGSLGGSRGDRDERDGRREAPRALGLGRRVLVTGSESVSAASTDRKANMTGIRRRVPKARAVARNALALNAHNPKVRRAPRRVHAAMRARKLRPQLHPRRGALRRPKLPGVLEQTKGMNALGRR